MTTITNVARTAAIARILKDAFDARQADLHARMDAEIGAIAKAKWPRFYELRADEAERPFVPANLGLDIRYGNRICVQMVQSWYEFALDEWMANAKTTTIETPFNINWEEFPCLPEDCLLVGDYWKYLEELVEAREKLVFAFSAYNTREKLEVDRPDLARYLPPQVFTGNSVIEKPAGIDLEPGELYAGLIIGKYGNQNYHLILLPDKAGSINWEDAKAWAKGQGGELPSRREQSLLHANLCEQFKPECYWSCQQHEKESDFAWCQLFTSGTQSRCLKCNELCARAVRRLPI